MSWTLHTLDLGEVELNQRRMVVNADAPGVVRVPVQGWLLVQGDMRVVIDTGFRFPDILKRLGDNACGIEQPHQRQRNFRQHHHRRRNAHGHGFRIA